MSEQRCPSCGALVSPDAEWCGQCFTSLVEQPDPSSSHAMVRAEVPRPAPPAPAGAVQGGGTPPVPSPAGEAVGGGSGKQPVWTCPACSGSNPLEADACLVCGTPFARLFEEQPVRRDVSPGRAVAWSLLYPGLGHRLVGRGGDGLARGALYTLAIGMLLLLVLGRAGEPLGPIVGMLALFGSAAAGISAFTATEAWQLALGGNPLATPRQVAWAAAGLVIVSLVFAVIIATTASSGGR